MPSSGLRMRQRVLTVAAATLVALACGTNYAYSAWAPQFRHRMKYSSTESNLIGAAGNLGTYATGVVAGLLVDTKGPRPALLIGAVCLFVGYFPLHRAYAGGPGTMAFPLLLFFSFLSGAGSCSAFSAAIKTAASNFPHHRGSATSAPLAAYGLSAFFWSTISTVAFRENTDKFLLLLAIGTSSMILVASLFVRIIPHPTSSYSSIPDEEPILRPQSSRLLRTRSGEGGSDSETAPGTQPDFPSFANVPGPSQSSSSSAAVGSEHTAPDMPAEETSSLMRGSPRSWERHDHGVLEGSPVAEEPHHNSLYLDVRGFRMLGKVEFWQQFGLMGILTGIGLMTINNIGNDVRALWKYYDDSVDSGFLEHRQAVHVSALSILSCCGRLLSGIGSDFLVKRLRVSRLWCLFASSILFCISQLAGARISDPHHLIVVSSITGMGYGMLFGVFPSIVSHTFGIDGLSQNWGIMTLAAIFGGYVFNLFYGFIYDRNSIVSDDGDRDCREGLACYSTAYIISFWAGVVAAVLTLWSIWHERQVASRRQAEKANHDRMV